MVLKTADEILDEMGYPQTYKGIPQTIEELRAFQNRVIKMYTDHLLQTKPHGNIRPESTKTA